MGPPAVKLLRELTLNPARDYQPQSSKRNDVRGHT